MKRYLFLIVALFLTIAANAQTEQNKSQHQQQKAVKKAAIVYVYVCESGNSVKYHKSETCRGLSKCKAGVREYDKKVASLTHDPCKICYPD